MNLRSASLPLVLVALASGCAHPTAAGGAPASVSPTPTATASPSPLLSGVLIGGTGPYPGAIQGVHFRTATQSGFTDAAGTFRFLSGETVTFSVGGVDFLPAKGAAYASPWQLSSGSCTQGTDLTHLLVILQSLDLDGNPANGIADPAVAPGASQQALSSLTDAGVAAFIGQLIPGRAAVSASSATNAFITQMDGEQWQQLSVDEFMGATGLTRSQGATSDGTHWYFSWELGLQKTDLDFNTVTSTAPVIPTALAALGDNHIGDIDWWNGTLYIPIEDGSAYKSPYLATASTASLDVLQTFPVSNTLMTAGVPWVAADGPRSSLYIAQWNDTTQINVFDMATGAYSRSIPISSPLQSIQGAKVFEGELYAAVDDSSLVKNFVKINLETGTVIPVFQITTPVSFEQEGLAFLARPDGSEMHTLNVRSDKLGSEFRHHARTRLPLRKSVCQ